MESPPPPPQPPIEADVASAANPNSGNCSTTVENHTGPNSTSNVIVIKKKMKNKKKMKDVQKSHIDISSDHPQRSSNASSSSSSTTSNLLHPRSKGIRISNNRRNPRVSNGPVLRRQSGIEADALALPLGMSMAAFVAQVLERKDATGEKMSADHLSQLWLEHPADNFSAVDYKVLICTLAVKESLSNVFGDKFDCFVSNFERSFQSTLMTLRVITESSGNREERPYLNGEGSSTCDSGGNDFKFDMKENGSTCQDQTTVVGEDEEIVHLDPVYNELAVLDDSRNGQQLACVLPNQLHSGVNNQSMLSTLERSVSEQTRSNDLKAFEISLIMKKMKLKEAQIAVDCDSNYLERFKLSMGISKASFRAEKFKTELEDSRHAQLLKKCVDCLVAGLLIMLACLAYGTYVHSHQRLIDATESCTLIKESSSWWIPNPMASFSSGFQILRCQVQVISRMLFGVLMIIAITYLLIQRSGTANQTMPVTFILLLLGVVCGFAGKLCIDTLGGSGNHWLFYWEVLCLVHFFANVCTSMLFLILHGPVTVTEKSVSGKVFPIPYWLRRFVFYGTVLAGLPLVCGLIPFAGPGEWLEHFVSMFESRVS